jgi:putative hydrolase of the HAD superfamily
MKNEPVRQALIMFAGYPSTGKTTSTQRLYYQFMNNYSVSLLSTLSVRETLGLMDDLHSEEKRQKVYDTIATLAEEKIGEQSDFIILDGNFNRRHRREAIYRLRGKYPLDIYVVECVVNDMESIQKRLDQREKRAENPQHKAYRMDTFNLIKESADPISEDRLPNGTKPLIIQYDTEKQSWKLESTSPLDGKRLQVVEQIIEALHPPLAENRPAVAGDVSKGQVKAVIFDIGGVIQPLRWELVTKRVGKVKPGLSMDEFRNAFYFEKEKYFGLYETAQINAIEFWTMVANQIGVPIGEIGYLSECLGSLYSDVDEDIKDLILQLKEGYSLYTLSNSCLELERTTGLYSNQYQHFDKLYFSHRIGWKKPDQEAFLWVLRDTGLRGEECIFVDDVSANVMAAQSVGMIGILYVSPQKLIEEIGNLLSYADNDR